MDVDEEEDLVPEITKAHFEEAMKFARRLVPDFLVALINCFLSSGPCPTTTSRSTRCSPRPSSSPVASATTSASPTVPPEATLRLVAALARWVTSSDWSG